MESYRDSDFLEVLGKIKPHVKGMLLADAITHFFEHGALQSFSFDSTIDAKLKQFDHSHQQELREAATRASLVVTFRRLQDVATNYFAKLVEGHECEISSSLMSHLTFPVKGRMYSEDYQPSSLPASITFVGQFIDHDLTKNATSLISDQRGRIEDFASPFIDLDSVYGPRLDNTGEAPGGYASPLSSDKNKFKLNKLDTSNNAYDVQRNQQGAALIADGRNDENQMILQVHLLIMRIHNCLVNKFGLTFDEAQRETVFNWQSVVLNDHQDSVIDKNTLDYVLQELEKSISGQETSLKYKPDSSGRLALPHEFAIGFRYGHSQLRDFYFVAPNRGFELFDNLDPGPNYKDLRGGRALIADRAIDWEYFIDPADNDRRSNKLDTLIASDVFNLPESAVPDGTTKFIGNLPQRNLIRSRLIGLTSGEDLFDFYFGSNSEGRLVPDQVESDFEKQPLYVQSDGSFRTPLWYYLLKEAELAGGSKLGKLGSRLVAEVVCGAVYYNPVSYVRDPRWVSRISHSRVVRMTDLAKFVAGVDAT